ncbi:hypothetical protein [Rufibacter roseolus]|uniref:hypothetical protein n=1 Tax=Rufibacter roseolus TaxID=2817375 RepID=UPI001B303D87|nr:hypothetical protein [Rufibacter roseolus]
MNREKLKIELGAPEHGWLPVNLAFENFDLQFEASDVPANPVDQLITSLRNVIKGIKTEVWWHLEPQGYYFEFERIGNEYSIGIYFANSDISDRRKVFVLTGSFNSLILPIYRAILKFIDKSYEEINWPKTHKSEIEKLIKLVKETKTTQNNV